MIGTERLAALALLLPLLQPAAAEEPPQPQPQASLEELSSAIERLEVERRRAGADAVADRLDRRLADLHVLLARKLTDAGRHREAVDAYERALALVSGHRIAAIELGWLSIRADEDERARRVALDAAMRHPDDAQVEALLGELAYRADRLRRAAAHYRRAAELTPQEAAFAERLTKIERELKTESGYDRADSGHFTLRFDGEQDEQLADLLLDPLEDAWDELGSELDVLPRQPITVVLYTREAFHDTTRAHPRVAGLYDGKIRLPAGGLRRVTPSLERVVRHELVHALLHVKGRGRVPRWLHEGLAQRLEPRPVDPALQALRAQASGETPALEPFSYPKALAFVAFLEEEYSRGRVLWLVELLAESRSEHDAFLEAFGADRQELVDAWGRWLNQPR
jgi:tetratricopeptide (TPR) repeat protein